MDIGVIGGGSIGLLLSSYLCDRHNVTLYVKRQEQKEILNEKGLFLFGNHIPFRIHTLLIEDIKDADCFIVCVKQHQILDVLPYLNKISSQTPMIFLQNGMEHLDKIQELNHDLYVGVVEHGALKKSDHHVSHTGKGNIYIATYRGNTPTLLLLKDELNQSLFPVLVSSDWENLLLKKLIVNAIINPVTSIFDVPNKGILTNPYIYSLVEKLCFESAMVLDLDYQTELERIKNIVYQTGGNISSMLLDIRMGRETEIDAISGYIMQRSDSEVPYTSFVYHSVKAIEFKNRVGKADG